MLDMDRSEMAEWVRIRDPEKKDVHSGTPAIIYRNLRSFQGCVCVPSLRRETLCSTRSFIPWN